MLSLQPHVDQQGLMMKSSCEPFTCNIHRFHKYRASEIILGREIIASELSSFLILVHIVPKIKGLIYEVIYSLFCS